MLGNPPVPGNTGNDGNVPSNGIAKTWNPPRYIVDGFWLVSLGGKFIGNGGFSLARCLWSDDVGISCTSDLSSINVAPLSANTEKVNSIC